MRYINEPEMQLKELPEKIYHIVPIKLYEDFTDKNGNYDPRNKENFGGNAPFIHTTQTLEQINKNLLYFHLLNDKEFYLLEILPRTLNNIKVTFNLEQNIIFHHLWCLLKPDNYKLYLSRKDKNKEMEIIKEIKNAN